MSIQSMTGYSRLTKRLPAPSGKRQAGLGGHGTLTVEMRSTNHRFLEISQRLPEGLLGFEGQVAELIRRHVRRGRIDVNVTARLPQAVSRRVALDEALLDVYHGRLLELKSRYGLKGSLTLDHLLTLPYVVSVVDDQQQRQALWPQIQQILQEALRHLMAMRRAEGARLIRDIQTQGAVIRRALKTVRARLPKSIAQYRQRLQERLKLVVGDALSPAQAQEALAVVREADIQEELVRLDSHLVHLEQTLKTGALIGKKLDFIAQELMREANTLGAKANDALIARAVIDLKGAIENIREQAQNLE